MLKNRFLSAAVLAGAVAFAAPACTAAYSQRYPVSAPRISDRAFNQGYRDGLDAGRSDARHHRRFSPERAARFRSADHDYNRRYGSRDQYMRIYRDGFREGYERGFRAYR
jgi:hypothetical protein